MCQGSIKWMSHSKVIFFVVVAEFIYILIALSFVQ